MTGAHRKEMSFPHENLVLIEQYGGLEEAITPALPMTGGQGPKPETDLQALMQAPPGHEPEESQQGHDRKVEALRLLLESGVLDERELWVVEATHWRRLSLGDVAQELSLAKSYVHRILKGAEEKLGTALRAAADVASTPFEEDDDE